MCKARKEGKYRRGEVKFEGATVAVDEVNWRLRMRPLTSEAVKLYSIRVVCYPQDVLVAVPRTLHSESQSFPVSGMDQ